MKTMSRGKSAFLLPFLALVLLATFPVNGLAQKWLPLASSIKALVMPEPMSMKWKISESFKLTATTVIVLPSSSSKEELDIALWLKKGFYLLWGTNPEIMVTDLFPEGNAIIIGTAKDKGLASIAPSISAGKFGAHADQGYIISATPKRVCLVGVGVEGLKNGAQTLLQATCTDSYLGVYVIPPLEISDFPAVNMRAVLIPLRSYRFYSQVADTRSLIDLAQMLHINTVIFQVSDAIKYDSVPGVGRKDSLPRDTLKSVINYAREAGLEVIPMIETFSHQDLLLCPAYPKICLDKSTYDPSNPEVYTKLFAIIDEVVDMFQPKYVHISHDEIRALYNMPQERVAELFVSDIRKIHSHLKEKNVQMIMWAGMLESAIQFPGQDNCNGLLGNTYALIDSLPKDIILMDAHYRQKKTTYPTVDYLLSKGFRVIGCTYDDAKIPGNFGRPAQAHNFSTYMAGKGGGFLGMTVALWGCYAFDGMGTPRRLLFNSAQEFWRGGVPPEDPQGERIPLNLRPNLITNILE